MLEMVAADVGELVAVVQPAEVGAKAQAGVGSASSPTISGAQQGLVAEGQQGLVGQCVGDAMKHLFEIGDEGGHDDFLERAISVAGAMPST